jgi:hypothetical protein
MARTKQTKRKGTWSQEIQRASLASRKRKPIGCPCCSDGPLLRTKRAKGTHEITITGESSAVKASFNGTDDMNVVKAEIAKQTGASAQEIELHLETRDLPVQDTETVEDCGFPSDMWMSKKSVRVKVSGHLGYASPKALTNADVAAFCKSDGKTTNIIDLKDCVRLSAQGLHALQQCACLQELVLAGCSLDNEDMQEVAKLLAGNEVLSSLDLSDVADAQDKYDNEQLYCSCGMCFEDSELECSVHLSSEDCESNEDCCELVLTEFSPMAKVLIPALNCGALISLTLSGNGLATEKRGKLLAEMLMANTNLQVLRRSCTPYYILHSCTATPIRPSPMHPPTPLPLCAIFPDTQHFEKSGDG